MVFNPNDAAIVVNFTRPRAMSTRRGRVEGWPERKKRWWNEGAGGQRSERWTPYGLESMWVQVMLLPLWQFVGEVVRIDIAANVNINIQHMVMYEI